ncbi:MAG: UDP-2,3-diacylglucosamine diphosphatase LpxI [Rickettsiales bacterium]|jgi:UDP-2,3-diacylglucosamine hydrolase|nr:UDP-2,3-diacylglucosamine diphosphatase LpxI [Rickettsiales bacterium]
MKKNFFGIIAGSGEIPHYIINELSAQNTPFCVVSVGGLFKRDNNSEILCNEFSIGQVSGILNFLHSNNVTKLCLVGKVTKPKFSELKVDLKGSVLLAQIGKNKLLGDDNILRTVISFIEKHDIEVISALDICDKLIMQDRGLYTKSKLYKDFEADVNITKDLHHDLAKFDIGQSLIMQDKRIIGIEGSEGTDNLIKRCEPYIDVKNRKPAILAKFAKKNQDLRVDLPTIGLQTLQNMVRANIKILLVDSKNTLFVNKQEVLSFANENKILIYGI